jgi:hypothetical protein
LFSYTRYEETSRTRRLTLIAEGRPLQPRSCTYMSISQAHTKVNELLHKKIMICFWFFFLHLGNKDKAIWLIRFERLNLFDMLRYKSKWIIIGLSIIEPQRLNYLSLLWCKVAVS